MYLRITKRKNRDGGIVKYYQLAHNERHPDTKKPVARIIHNFGRADQLDPGELARLCRSIARVCHLNVVDPMDETEKGDIHVSKGLRADAKPTEEDVLNVTGDDEPLSSGTAQAAETIEPGGKLTEKTGVTASQAPAGMLPDTEEKYRIIFENANDLIFFVGIDGRFLEINKKLEEIFGYKREEFMGKHFSEIGVLSQEDLQKVNKEDFTDQADDMLEFKVFRKDRSIAHVEVSPRTITKNGKIIGTINIVRDITKQKLAEEKLKRAHEDLERKVKERTINLEEMNAALKILLEKRDEDKVELEEKMLFNVKELIIPYLERLNKSRLDRRQKTCVQIIESNLNDIISPFIRGMHIKHLKFTPAEIQVANLVKQGKTTKEIADLLNLSTKTIEFHRENIRKKVGLKHKKVNLRSYLLSIE